MKPSIVLGLVVFVIFLLLVAVVLYFCLRKESFSAAASNCWPLTASDSTSTQMYFIVQINQGEFSGYFDQGTHLVTDLTTPFVISPSGANWKCTVTFAGSSFTDMTMTFDYINLETGSTCPDCLTKVNYMVHFPSGYCGHGGETVHYTNRLLNNIQISYNRIAKQPSGSACTNYKTSWVLPASSTNYYSHCNSGTNSFGGWHASGDCWPLTCNSSDATRMYFIVQVRDGFFSGLYDCFDNYIPIGPGSAPFRIQPPNTTWVATITFRQESPIYVMTMTFDAFDQNVPSLLDSVYFMVQFDNGVCNLTYGGNFIYFYNNTATNIGIHYNRLAHEPQGNACANYSHSWTLPAFAASYYIDCVDGNDFSSSYTIDQSPCLPKTTTDSTPSSLFAWVTMEHGGFSGFYQGSSYHAYTSRDDATVMTVQQAGWEVVAAPYNHDNNTCKVPNGLRITIRSLSSSATSPPPSTITLKNMYLMFQYLSGTCGCTYAVLQFVNETSTNIVVNYNRLAAKPLTNACANYQYQGVVNGNSTMYAFCDNITTAFGFLQENDTPCNVSEECWWNNLLKYTCYTMATPFVDANTTAACSGEWWACEDVCAAAVAANPELEAACPGLCTALEQACEATVEAVGVVTAEDLCAEIGL